MHFDNNLRLASAQVFTGDGYAANSIDLFQAQDLGAGKPMSLRIVQRATVTGPPTSVRIQAFVYTTPMNTFSGTLSVTTITVGANATMTTSTAHGMSLGTQFFLAAGPTYPTGVAPSTVYYAIPVTSTTFRFATTYANAAAGTAVTTSGAAFSGGPATLTLFGIEVWNSAVLPSDFNAFTAVGLPGLPVTKPLYIPVPPVAGFPAPAHVQVPAPLSGNITQLPMRWFNIKIFTGGTLTGATMDIDLVHQAEDMFKFYPTGIVPGIIGS